jgi:hypothetical protein
MSPEQTVLSDILLEWWEQEEIVFGGQLLNLISQPTGHYILLKFLPPTPKEEWRGKPSQESLFSVPAKDIETLDRDQVYGSPYRLTMIFLWSREYVDSISLSSDDAILFTRRTATVNAAAHRIALTYWKGYSDECVQYDSTLMVRSVRVPGCLSPCH